MSETPPPLQKVASVPIFGPDSCDNGVGLWLIDVSSLAKGLEHLCCCKCSEEKVDTHVQDFLEFHAEKMKSAKLLKIKNPLLLEESYEHFKVKEKDTTCSCLVSVSMSSKTVGFATTLNFHCHVTLSACRATKGFT